MEIPMGIRLDDKTRERLDKLAFRLSRPGEIISRSEVARRAIAMGLPKLEAEQQDSGDQRKSA